VGEIQIVRSLKDVYYAHASWDVDGIKAPETLTKIDLHLLDRDGPSLSEDERFCVQTIRSSDSQKENSPKEVARPKDGNGQEGTANLQFFVPVWNAACLGRIGPEGASAVNQDTSFGWQSNSSGLGRRKSCPKSHLLESIAISSIDHR